MDDLEKPPVTNPHVGFTQYWAALGPCKNLAQWKGKLVSKAPSEAATATKSPADCGRLLALAFIYQSSLGDEISADLKGKSHFLGSEEETWLSQ